MNVTSAWAPRRITSQSQGRVFDELLHACAGSRHPRRRRRRDGRPSASSSSSAAPRPRRRGRPACPSVAPTARIAACGGLSTATNCSIPNMPRFEIVNVPSSRSCAVSLLSRARPTTSPRAPATSASESRSTERTTGTTSPCGAATAIPTFAVGNLQQRVLGVLHVHVAVAHQRLRARPSRARR